MVMELKTQHVSTLHEAMAALSKIEDTYWSLATSGYYGPAIPIRPQVNLAGVPVQPRTNNLVRTEEPIPPPGIDQPKSQLAVGIVIRKVTSRETQSVLGPSQAPHQQAMV